MKLVSVIIPCYNASKSIKRCIDSLINQSYKNIEVLLIDDGSTDDTKKIINNLLKGKLKFKYIYKENSGVSDTRNLGIKKSLGEYLCFIDSDDYVEKDFVLKLINKLEENDSDIVACNFKRIYKKKITESNINKDIVKSNIYSAPWNKMYKRDLIVNNNVYFPSNIWYEDIYFTTKAIYYANKIDYVEDNLYNYIQNDVSLIHTYDNRIFDINKIVELLEKDCNGNKDLIEFINIYHVLIGTVYRCSFHENFSSKMIEEICLSVEKKYKKWYKNTYINKVLNFKYKIYLSLIKYKLYYLIYILLKLFNRFLYL